MTKRFVIPLENTVLSIHLWLAKEFVYMDAIDRNMKNTKLFTASSHESESLPGIMDTDPKEAIAIGLDQESKAILNINPLEFHTAIKVKEL